MNLKTRCIDERNMLRSFNVTRDAVVLILTIALLTAFWPLRTVPTGTRGVVTMGGKVDRVVEEGFRWVWRDAEDLNRAVDNQSNALAELLRGRLRTVASHHLAALKRELQQFNAHTGIWKEDR